MEEGISPPSLYLRDAMSKQSSAHGVPHRSSGAPEPYACLRRTIELDPNYAGPYAAAGLPEPSPDHAETLARYALDLREAMEGKTFADAPLKLRIGIHSGPAVAGVIGLSRFAYDLWGDTVNVASRIQRAAKPDEIQLSDVTRELLDAKFICTAAGEVETRGAARVGVWRLDRESKNAPAVGVPA
jgi:class 3 adenylate cyclase